MIIKKAIVSTVAAGALALAMTAAPKPAQAFWWVVPAIVAGTVGGVAVGAAATNNAAYNAAYEPRGEVYVAPTAACHWERVQAADGRWARARVCP